MQCKRTEDYGMLTVHFARARAGMKLLTPGARKIFYFSPKTQCLLSKTWRVIRKTWRVLHKTWQFLGNKNLHKI